MARVCKFVGIVAAMGCIFLHGQFGRAEEPAGKPAKAVKADRVLFLGNSITLHGPAAEIGWLGNWGMAASAKEKDYVHLLTASLAKRNGKQPEIQVDNIADFERQYDTFDLARLKKHFDFKADLVILAIGENVSPLTTEASRVKFHASLVRLLKALKEHGRPAIYVRSNFWPDKTKDDILKKAAEETAAVFVDMSELGRDASNQARAERNIAHAGVAGHPGDKGMKAIADALFQAITEQKRPGR
jgi:lysophospholipase L1-like esterase